MTIWCLPVLSLAKRFTLAPDEILPFAVLTFALTFNP
jgi:hypothetical protein